MRDDLIYLNDEFNSVVERIFSDQELSRCNLTREGVESTLESFKGDEIASSVFLKKYALRGDSGTIIEYTLEDAKDRWSNAILEGEEKCNGEKDFNYFRELYDYLLPAGRQMYALGNKYVPKTTYSNCYVTKIQDDSIEGIYDAAKSCAKTYSYGGGIGLCIGELRPDKSKVSNSAGQSTGAVSFMELFSHTTGLIGQNSRRGALLISIPIDHPDVELFVDIKKDNIDKVKNANISVKITDAFMKAVENDDDFELKFETSHEVIQKTVKARELWHKIITAAHSSAEPGILFWDTSVDMSPSDTYEDLKVHCTNPCFTGDMKLLTVHGYKSFAELEGQDVEIISGIDFQNSKSKVWCSGEKEVIKLELSDGQYIKCTPDHVFMSFEGEEVQAKDLLNVRIKSFLEDTKHLTVTAIENIGTEKVYDFTEPRHHWGIVNNCIVHNCGEILLEPGSACVLSSLVLSRFVSNPFTDQSEFNFDKFREMVARGVRHLDNIVEMNLEKHPLEEQKSAARNGRRIGLGITGLADMLASLGIKYDSQEALDFIDNLMEFKKNTEYRASMDLAKERGSFLLFDAERHFERGFCETLSEELKQYGRENGLRNVTISTCAPNGSLSIIAQCSSGVEPIFALSYKRYVMLGENRKEFIVHHPGVNRYFEETGKEEISDIWVEAHNIDYMFRVKMQGVLQGHIDSSISSTINLPEDVKVSVVGDIYMEAWKGGLKGITVYREGSREGILVTNDFAKRAGMPDMDTSTYKIRAESGDKFYIMVSYIGKDIQRPYQIFIQNYKQSEKESFVRVNNMLVKMLRDEGVEETRVQKYIDRSKNSLSKLTRFLSLSMKTGHLDKAVGILEENAFIGTLAHKLHEILSKSIEAKHGLCKECGSNNVAMEEGCNRCLDCGYSGCG